MPLISQRLAAEKCQKWKPTSQDQIGKGQDSWKTKSSVGPLLISPITLHSSSQVFLTGNIIPFQRIHCQVQLFVSVWEVHRNVTNTNSIWGVSGNPNSLGKTDHRWKAISDYIQPIYGCFAILEMNCFL